MLISKIWLKKADECSGNNGIEFDANSLLRKQVYIDGGENLSRSIKNPKIKTKPSKKSQALESFLVDTGSK